MRWLLPIVAVCCPGMAARAARLDLAYHGAVAGVPMVDVTGRLELDSAGYTLRVGLHTIGLAARLMRGRSDIIEQGVWDGVASRPTHLDSEGYWNGRQRRLIVDYVEGVPTLRVVVPPRPAGRQAPEAAGTIDGLGLLVGLMRQVTTTGRCDRQADVYDGHGLTRFDATTAAPETVQKGAFAGRVLRCDFTTRKHARPGEAPDGGGRTDHGYALSRLPEARSFAFPLMIVFQRGWLGDAVLMSSLGPAQVPGGGGLGTGAPGP